MEIIEFVINEDRYHLQQAMIEWCKVNISQNYGWREPDRLRWGDDWGVATDSGITSFMFLEHKHATVFALRWLT